MVIGTVYKTETCKIGTKVHNVPHSKLDYPCDRGCCENMLSIGMGTSLKVNWLLNTYLPENNLVEFDFNDWTVTHNDEWKKQMKM